MSGEVTNKGLPIPAYRQYEVNTRCQFGAEYLFGEQQCPGFFTSIHQWWVFDTWESWSATVKTAFDASTFD
jgi:hypothetical protein